MCRYAVSWSTPRRRPQVAVALVVAFAMSCPTSRARSQGEPSPSDEQLSASVARATIMRAAVARNPSVGAASQRAHAVELSAKAEGSLPPPEAMVQMWQVPIARPYALNNQMIMVGVSQSFPSPGARAARAEAKQHEARVEEATAGDRARLVAQGAEHAFADYVETTERHRIHEEHLDIAKRVLDLARARHAAGGSFGDAAQAEVEYARVEADVITDAMLVASARARINALLSRKSNAPLGAPLEEAPGLPALSTDALLERAHEARPELRAADANVEAKRSNARAADREATWPSFGVAALYFAPTTSMPEHGYGVNASMSLPWLWGAADRRSDAERQALLAATTSARGAHVPVDVEVVTADAAAKSAAFRLQVIRERALPASKRAFEVALAGYESGRADALSLLASRRAVVDVETEIVVAHAALDHALADLDAAVGAPVPRVALRPLDERLLSPGDSHAR